jgi:hypothetical protein
MRKFLRFLLIVAIIGGLGYFVAVPVGAVYLGESHQFVTVTPHNAATTDTENGAQVVTFKLFGILPIKRVNVDVLPFECLYAGGATIGFQSGMGTITYINPSDNNFCALGHKLDDFTGDGVYVCNVMGIEPSAPDRVGSYESTLKKSGGLQGNVLHNTDHGVYGCLRGDSVFLDSCNKLYPVGGRYGVKRGKAKILTSLDGKSIGEYDVEILKCRWQQQNACKGIVLRVTDPRLLEKTGGIVHGMSGSPIIQNGKLVGAVTHVLTNDVTKGYGIYVDFLVA